MLFKASYSSKEDNEEIEKRVGKAYSFFERLKMGGNGSQRLLVKEANVELAEIWKYAKAPVLTSIELRPNGVLVWFRVKLDNWVLALPYYQLSIVKSTDYITIHAKQWKLKLSPANNLPLKMNFFQKLLHLKDESSGDANSSMR